MSHQLNKFNSYKIYTKYEDDFEKKSVHKNLK